MWIGLPNSTFKSINNVQVRARRPSPLSSQRQLYSFVAVIIAIANIRNHNLQLSSINQSINQSIMFAHRTRGLSSNSRVNINNNALGNHNENLPASNLQKPSANSNVLKPLNGNTNGNGSNSITKTPSASIKRRALGDISNKKGGDHSNARGGGGGKAKIGDTNTSTTRKPAAKIWNDSVTPRRLPLQPSSIKQQQQQQLNKPKEASSLKPSRTVAFQLPQRHSQSLVLPHAKTVLQEPLTAQPELEPVDDVEFSAGRLFCDQVENDDDDDLSVLSIEAPLSMWDDWKFALKLQVQEQQQMTIAQDAKLQAKINQVMAQDGTSW
jgi:hypothetical protein